MIPKSLHTITALANVARHLSTLRPSLPLSDPTVAKGFCIDAAIILGYANHSDDYGLIDKAAKALAAGRTK